MGYKAKVNVRAGGKQYQAGEAYVGPSELVEGLLKEGLIEADSSVVEKPGSVEQVAPRQGYTAPEEEEDIFDKPVKKKGKGK